MIFSLIKNRKNKFATVQMRYTCFATQAARPTNQFLNTQSIFAFGVSCVVVVITILFSQTTLVSTSVRSLSIGAEQTITGIHLLAARTFVPPQKVAVPTSVAVRGKIFGAPMPTLVPVFTSNTRQLAAAFFAPSAPHFWRIQHFGRRVPPPAPRTARSPYLAPALAFATSSPRLVHYSVRSAATASSLMAAPLALGHAISSATQASIQGYTDGIYVIATVVPRIASAATDGVLTLGDATAHTLSAVSAVVSSIPNAYVDGIYAIADTAPRVAAATTNGMLALSNPPMHAVSAVVSSIPNAYVDGIYAIADTAPRVAAAGFSVEQVIGNRFFNLSQRAESANMAFIQRSGNSLADSVAAIGTFPTYIANIVVQPTNTHIQTIANISSIFSNNSQGAAATSTVPAPPAATLPETTDGETPVHTLLVPLITHPSSVNRTKSNLYSLPLLLPHLVHPK